MPASPCRSNEGNQDKKRLKLRDRQQRAAWTTSNTYPTMAKHDVQLYNKQRSAWQTIRVAVMASMTKSLTFIKRPHAIDMMINHELGKHSTRRIQSCAHNWVRRHTSQEISACQRSIVPSKNLDDDQRRQPALKTNTLLMSMEQYSKPVRQVNIEH